MQTFEREVYGNTYRFGKLNAVQQFHVMRRLYSVSSALGSGFDTLQKRGGASAIVEKSKSGEKFDIMPVITPLITAIGKMSDEDVEYVLNTCLSVVERQVKGSGGWSRVQSAPGQMMYEDIDMKVMMVLVWRTLESNLAGFFLDLLSGLSEAMTPDRGSNS